MKTSSVAAGNTCPKCHDEVTQDLSGKGFVRHMSNPNCDFERGQRDLPRTVKA